jgi:hypothetical protein
MIPQASRKCKHIAATETRNKTKRKTIEEHISLSIILEEIPLGFKKLTSRLTRLVRHEIVE